MKKCAMKIYVPAIHSVSCDDGNKYFLGGLPNAEIKKLGAAITKDMLKVAKAQRVEMRKKGQL
jgi:hypothetical protein